VPIATWLNALGVAQFASRHAAPARGVPLQTWVFPQDRDRASRALEGPARQALEFYSDYVGPYPYEKLGNVQAAGFSGGMEHASVIFFDQAGFYSPGLVAHEVAHQWFGNSVTEKDWDDVWLSEGFATYFALMFTEHYEGRDAFVAGLKRSRTTVLATESRGADRGVVHDNLRDTGRILNDLVYQKGAWTLHLLRGQVGAEKFQAGIREYYKRYRDGNASTDDLRAVMEEASGQELKWFFDQWLRRPGSPVVAGTWRYDAEVQRVEIELTQTQPGEPFRLPLEVAVAQDGGASPRVVKVEMSKKKQRFEIPAAREPGAVELDPNTWVLMQASFNQR
jgi:aminopeptidase N